MKYYRLTATLLAPLIIQQDRQSHAPGGLDFLPGSTLRGALAAKFLRQGGNPDNPGFRSLFIEDPASFPSLFPTDNPQIIPQVLPCTTISCKRQPGFLSQGKHGVRDSLTLIAGNRTWGEKGDEKFWTCPDCGQELKPFSGFWNGDPDNPQKNEVTRIYQRHTGIDRQTGTVALGIFYTTQAMGNYRKDATAGDFKQQYLAGGTFLTLRQLEILEEIITNGPIFVGADRARGFGEIELAIAETTFGNFDLPDWSQRFRERVSRVTGRELPGGLYFSVKLESPAILLDQFLRPTAQLTMSFPGIEMVLKVAKPHKVRGWQSSWGLPKPDDLALAPGSIFLFRYLGEDPVGLANFLKQMIMQSMGCRKAEGFGRFSVCEPLHLREVI